MNQELVNETLINIARLMELAGENVFKTRAFNNGARALRQLEEKEFNDLVKQNKLQDIPGIGAGLEEAILAILKTGTTETYEELKKEIPQGLLEFYKIPGLGAKRILRLYEALEVTNLGELEYACQENRLLKIAGFGEKRQEEILQGIATLKEYQSSYLYSQAFAEAELLRAKIEKLNVGGKQKITGSLRRKTEIVDKIEILMTNITKKDFLNEHNLPLQEVTLDENVVTAKTKRGIPVIFHFTERDRWGTDLLTTTGSRSHLQFLTQEKELPLKKEEEEIYAQLGLSFIPPELREGLYETSPEADFSSLISLKDIKGVFHNHSNYSDGINTLEEIAQHGKKLGYSYIGIADHSQSAYYANGLKPDELLQQMEEIDAINKRNEEITLLKGLEADILADGSLDCEDALLAKLDYVVASVHSAFKMPEELMTNRILKALANPHITMLGHPTGRLLLAREPYALDLEEIIQTAKKHKVILEINANPMRLDLDWHWAKKAYDAGVLLSISPDAHRLSGYEFTKYGVNIARKAGLPKDAVLNTKSLAEVQKILKNKFD